MTSIRDQKAEATREKILDAASYEIYRCGFQASSIAEIIKKAGVSKGCFYHHFPTKQSLGYSVLEEFLCHNQQDIWPPALKSKNPLAAIIRIFTHTKCRPNDEQIKLGCPINNLAQEMSPLDEGFRERVENIYKMWRSHTADALARAQKDGYMRKDANPNEVAALIIAVTQGATGIAKNAQNSQVFIEYTRGLVRYLKSLATDS